MTSHAYYVGAAQVSSTTYRVNAGGELDMATREELSEALEGAIDSDVSEIEVDMTDVSFIDSTAIKVLAHAAGAMRSRGGRVGVKLGSRNVMRTFEIAGLERLLDLSLEVSSPAGAEEPVL